MATVQETIDNLISYIDAAVAKHSVSNRHVATVLAFLNEGLKALSSKYLSKTEDDTAGGYVTFLKGLLSRGDVTVEGRSVMKGAQEVFGRQTLHDGFETPDFSNVAGRFKGAQLTKNGVLTAAGIIAQSYEIFELIYNKIRSQGSRATFSDTATIESCMYSMDEAETTTLAPSEFYEQHKGVSGEAWNDAVNNIHHVILVFKKTEENSNSVPFENGDIIYGYVNKIGDSGQYARGGMCIMNIITEDAYINLNGSMMVRANLSHIVADSDNPEYVKTNMPPTDGMLVVQNGNVNGKEGRTTSFFIDSEAGHVIMLHHVTTPTITDANYAVISGLLPAGLLEKVQAHFSYIKAVTPVSYAKYGIFENILQFDHQGAPIKTERYRDAWSATAAVDNPYRSSEAKDVTYFDTTSHGGSKWKCLEDCTLEEPGTGNGWLLVVAKGDDGVSATLYGLMPSTTELVQREDGENTPVQITFDVSKIVGGTAITVPDSEKSRLKVLYYVDDLYEGNKQYDTIQINTAGIQRGVDAALFLDGVIVDSVSILVKRDGKTGPAGSAGADGDDGLSPQPNLIQNSNFDLMVSEAVTPSLISSRYGEFWVKLTRMRNANHYAMMKYFNNKWNARYEPYVEDHDGLYWCFVGTEENFKIYNKATGPAVSLSANASSGAACSMLPTSSAISWSFTVNGNGTHSIVTSINRGLGINSYSGLANGGELKLYSAPNDAGSQWFVYPLVGLGRLLYWTQESGVVENGAFDGFNVYNCGLGLNISAVTPLLRTDTSYTFSFLYRIEESHSENLDIVLMIGHVLASENITTNGTPRYNASNTEVHFKGIAGEWVQATATFKHTEDISVSFPFSISNNTNKGVKITQLKLEEGVDATPYDKNQNDFMPPLKSLVFKRGTAKPNSPTGGTYSNPIPGGWSDGIPEGNGTVYSSTCTFYAGGYDTGWSDVQMLADSADFDIAYCLKEQYTLQPPSEHPDGENEDWQNSPSEDAVWMAISKRNVGGAWSPWTITRVKGEKGDGIKSVTTEYIVTHTFEQPSNDANGWSAQKPSEVNVGDYLWTKVVTDYTSDSIEDTIVVTVSRAGTDGSSITVSSVKYATSVSATVAPTDENDWETEPIELQENEYLWTRTIFSDGEKMYTVSKNGESLKVASVKYAQTWDEAADPATLTYSDNVPTPEKGKYIWTRTTYSDGKVDYGVGYVPFDGEDAIYADLDNEMDSVGLDADGKADANYTITTNVSLFKGTERLNLTSLTSDLIEGVGLVEQTVNKDTGVVQYAVAKGEAVASRNVISITLVSDDVTKVLTLTVNGVKQGANGETAKIYKITPSTNQVIKMKDGTFLPKRVSCSGSLFVAGEEQPNASGIMLRYYKDGSAVATPYTSNTEIASSTFKQITFELVVDGVVQDVETISVVEDGANGDDGKTSNENLLLNTNFDVLEDDGKTLKSWTTQQGSIIKEGFEGFNVFSPVYQLGTTMPTLEAGKLYTFSLYQKSSATSGINTLIPSVNFANLIVSSNAHCAYNRDDNKIYFYFTEGVWQRASFTFRPTVDTTVIGFVLDNNSNKLWYLSRIKLEEGDTATAYQKHPDDLIGEDGADGKDAPMTQNNLIQNSNFEGFSNKAMSGWSINNTNQIGVAENGYNNQNYVSSKGAGLQTEAISSLDNTRKYAFSVYVRPSSANDFKVSFFANSNISVVTSDGSIVYDDSSSATVTFGVAAGVWTRVSVTISAADYGNFYIKFWSESDTFRISMPKLEEGEVVTPYIPAVADLTGPAGAAGEAVFPLGDWMNDVRYVRGDNYTISVHYLIDDKYYRLKKSFPEGKVGIAPNDTEYWEFITAQKAIHAEFIMANFAMFGSKRGGVFYDRYLFSQYGVNKLGERAYFSNYREGDNAMFVNIGTKDDPQYALNGKFVPNTFIDFYDGAIKCGKFSEPFTLLTKSGNGNYYKIDPTGNHTLRIVANIYREKPSTGTTFRNNLIMMPSAQEYSSYYQMSDGEHYTIFKDVGGADYGESFNDGSFYNTFDILCADDTLISGVSSEGNPYGLGDAGYGETGGWFLYQGLRSKIIMLTPGMMVKMRLQMIDYMCYWIIENCDDLAPLNIKLLSINGSSTTNIIQETTKYNVTTFNAEDANPLENLSTGEYAPMFLGSKSAQWYNGNVDKTKYFWIAYSYPIAMDTTSGQGPFKAMCTSDWNPELSE